MEKTKVEIYNCELKHGATTTTVHTIPKNGVTAREITLLRAMHGADSVLNIKPAGEREVDQKQELLLLARNYANTQDPFSGKKLVERVFSVVLANYEQWIEEQVELEQMEREEKRQKSQEEMRRITAAAQAAAEVAAKMGERTAA